MINYSHRITPENIVSLKENEIFVFGSNSLGRHGKGAAKQAIMFGAEYGNGYGLQGQTYAIPTKNRIMKAYPLEDIAVFVDEFIKLATSKPELIFLVTPIGCGLAGYSYEDIAPMFEKVIEVENIHLPITFWEILI
jgi:hypothetical protein